MASIPRDASPDSTLALASEGYMFIGNRAQRYGTDLFETRLMLQQAFCMIGEEAAEVFYVPDRFTRRGAIPTTSVLQFQDLGSALLSDGEIHRTRKEMFLSLMTPDRFHALMDLVADQWRYHIGTWAAMNTVVLDDEVQEILVRAACAWAGVPLPMSEAKQRTRDFSTMIDGTGSLGTRMLRGMLVRPRTERWMRNVIEQVRDGTLAVPEGSAAHMIAWHREPNGKLLDTSTAAVELINVLQPNVAVARFVTFAALALHDHPEWQERLEAGDDNVVEQFVQEVRRFYPLFPFVGGRAMQPFKWRDHHFDTGTWMLLDLYGTNHDLRIWGDPGVFRPERFDGWAPNALQFVPQGGGEYHTGHRCPAERPTIELMKLAVRMLTTAMRYDVPEQDLGINLSRIPAVPESRFLISNVRPAA